MVHRAQITRTTDFRSNIDVTRHRLLPTATQAVHFLLTIYISLQLVSWGERNRNVSLLSDSASAKPWVCPRFGLPLNPYECHPYLSPVTYQNSWQIHLCVTLNILGEEKKKKKVKRNMLHPTNRHSWLRTHLLVWPTRQYLQRSTSIFTFTRKIFVNCQQI